MKLRNLAGEICLLSALCAAVGMVSPAATFTVLKRFNGTNGGAPFAPMVQGLDGNLYGTTEYGGANSQGVVFKITPAGALTTLYSFCNEASCADGSSPLAGLVLATNGDFYGTAWAGGANGIGSIFSITPGGKLNTIYSFCSFTNCTDGAQP